MSDGLFNPEAFEQMPGQMSMRTDEKPKRTRAITVAEIRAIKDANPEEPAEAVRRHVAEQSMEQDESVKGERCPWCWSTAPNPCRTMSEAAYCTRGPSNIVRGES